MHRGAVVTLVNKPWRRGQNEGPQPSPRWSRAPKAAALTATKPNIAFAGGVDYAKPNARIFPKTREWQESWDVGVAVNWNFYDSGRAKSAAAEAAASVTATRERIAEFDSIVSADVRQRMLDLDSTQAVVRASADAVRSAAEARRVVSDRFNAGVATSTDVLVAQVALLESELARTRALAGLRLAEARLERVLAAAMSQTLLCLLWPRSTSVA